jgi:hypothetical protein
MLGTARPGVTIALQELVRRGWITHRRGVVTVIDRSRLIKSLNGAYVAPRAGHQDRGSGRETVRIAPASGVSDESKQLIEGASYGPDALKVVCQAFDEAWSSIEGNFSDDPETIETARLKLARVMLSIPLAHICEVEKVKTSALEMMALLYRTRTRAGLMDR